MRRIPLVNRYDRSTHRSRSAARAASTAARTSAEVRPRGFWQKTAAPRSSARMNDVTVLPNRALLLRRVGDGGPAADGSGICVVHVDGLKAVADAIGAGAADGVTALVAERLAAARPGGCLLARIGPAE